MARNFSYALPSLLDNALTSFNESSDRLADRKLRQRQLDQSAKQQDLENKIALFKSGGQLDQNTGLITEDPLYRKKQIADKIAEANIRAGTEGAMPTFDEETGLLKDYKVAPGKLKYETDVAKAKNVYKIDNADARETNKEVKALKDDLDPNKARGGNLAKSQAMINSADRVQTLFSQFPDGNIPAAQTHELASAVASLVSGGSSPQSQQQINSIVPSSARGNAEAMISWLTNEPRGQQQQKFMQLLQHTAEREKALAQRQVKIAQIQRLSAYENLKQKNPKIYNGILSAYGISPDEIDESGRYRELPQQGGHAGLIESASVKMIAPDGSIRMVPKEQVQNALNAGGKLAQ